MSRFRLPQLLATLAALAAAALDPGCLCTQANRIVPPGGYGDGGVPKVGTITINPPDVTLDLVQGGAAPSTSFMVVYHGQDADQDVTAKSVFTLPDMTAGTMNGNVFTAGMNHGGSVILLASYPNGTTMLSAQAVIHIRVHGTFTGGCPGCPPFPGDKAPACPGGMVGSATVVYPPDNVLLPPNMNVIELQWTPGTGTMFYEVDFENPATDVRVTTKCTPTVDTRMQMSGGCQLDLDPATWDFIAKSNRGGDPIQVTVRASPDGTCVFPSGNARKMAFAEQDVVGGLYYWQSVVVGGVAGKTGGIFRHDFGATTPTSDLVFGPQGKNLNVCVGCHALSRDGKKMTFNADDSDSDDEYGDMHSGLFDVATKTPVVNAGTAAGQPAGFQTFKADHTVYLGSDGIGAQPGMGFFYQYDGNTGAPGAPPTVAAGAMRVTQPDWAADDKNIVFVQPKAFVTWANFGGGGVHSDDSHITGGSLFTMPYMGGGTFGTPMPLVMSAGENNFYPSFAPDEKYVVFNRVPAGGMATADNDSFNNPHARIFLVPNNPGQTPIDLVNANDTGDLTNSWPRFSPFVQTYKGAPIYWVTFSSTRDYGLRVRNHTMVGGMPQVNCYPPDTPESPCPAGMNCHGTAFAANCNQPQIWMAAILFTTAEVSANTDPSLPAFWLPFQDITAHNHIAQWTSTVVTQTPPDGGVCIPAGGNCVANPNGCCGTYICGGNGVCTIP